MLGVIIGIVAVVMVVGIGEGTKRRNCWPTQTSSAKILLLSAPAISRPVMTIPWLILTCSLGLNSLSGLDESDIAVVQRSAHVSVAAPLGLVSGTVQTGNTQLQGALVLGDQYGTTYGDQPES